MSSGSLIDMKEKVKTILEDVLDNLDARSFKAFKSKLNTCPERPNWYKISKSILQKLKQDELADRIIRINTINYAPAIMMWALEEISERQACHEVRTKLKEVGYRSSNLEDKETQTYSVGLNMQDKTTLTDSGAGSKHSPCKPKKLITDYYLNKNNPVEIDNTCQMENQVGGFSAGPQTPAPGLRDGTNLPNATRTQQKNGGKRKKVQKNKGQKQSRSEN